MEIKSSILYCDRPRIKAPQIVNRNKFAGIRGEDCDLFRVIRGMYLSFHDHSVTY